MSNCGLQHRFVVFQPHLPPHGLTEGRTGTWTASAHPMLILYRLWSYILYPTGHIIYFRVRVVVDETKEQAEPEAAAAKAAGGKRGGDE
jgi:hypothetical protein